MQIGMIGLGRMGGNMVRRLLRGGHECVVYDLNPNAIAELVADGASGAGTLDEFVAEFGGLIRHPGEEFSYVLEGELDFHSELYAPVRLRAGDSIYFDSEMGHAYLKATVQRCTLLCSCAPRGPDDAVDAHVFVNTAGVRHSVEPLAPGAPTTPRRNA